MQKDRIRIFPFCILNSFASGFPIAARLSYWGPALFFRSVILEGPLMKTFSVSLLLAVLCGLPSVVAGARPAWSAIRTITTARSPSPTWATSGPPAKAAQNVQRLTAHRGRDMTPRFSPDGQWIAFSSDREGNLDVWVIPAVGGSPKQLTFHSSDDNVLGWSPDGKSVLFAASRGDDFLGTLYVVPLDGGGRDEGRHRLSACTASFSPDGTKLAVNRKGQSYWRKGYRGSYQTDVTVVDLKSKTFKDVTSFPGMDTWPMWGSDGDIYFVSDRDEKAQPNLWKVPRGRRRRGPRDHTLQRRRRALPRDQRRRQDDRVRARFSAVEARRGRRRKPEPRFR